jgi:hypothetical protein
MAEKLTAKSKMICTRRGNDCEQSIESCVLSFDRAKKHKKSTRTAFNDFIGIVLEPCFNCGVGKKYKKMIGGRNDKE